MRTTKYSDGTPILGLSGDGPWRNDEEGSYAIYPNSCFGFLYNWYAVDNAKGLCPTGWRLPSVSDWNKLLIHADPSLDTTTVVILKGSPGKKLKAIGPNHWVPSTNRATDQFGLSFLPSGRRGYSGEYLSQRESAYLWSSSYQGAQGSNYLIALVNNTEGDSSLINTYAQLYSYDPKDANSIRCVRDVSINEKIIYNWNNGDTSSRVVIRPSSSQTLTTIVKSGEAQDTVSIRINVKSKTYSLEKRSINNSIFPLKQATKSLFSPH